MKSIESAAKVLCDHFLHHPWVVTIGIAQEHDALVLVVNPSLLPPEEAVWIPTQWEGYPVRAREIVSPWT